MPSKPTDLVLVCLLRSPAQPRFARLLGWYRIPFALRPKLLPWTIWLFSGPRLFGERGGQIEYTAELSGKGERTQDILCPGSPPAGAVLPQIPRPASPNRSSSPTSSTAKTSTASPQRPCVSATAVSASSTQHVLKRDWHTLSLLRAQTDPPSPRRPQCGGGQAAPHVRHSLAQPGLLHHRL